MLKEFVDNYYRYCQDQQVAVQDYEFVLQFYGEE